MTISKCGKLIASGSTDGSIQVSNISNINDNSQSKKYQSDHEKILLNGHLRYVSAISFDISSKMLISGGYDS